jgi:hypothetical protein
MKCYQYSYEVIENGDDYTLGIYDRHGRKHFETEIGEEKYRLSETSIKEFVSWLEETFDDVIETLT